MFLVVTYLLLAQADGPTRADIEKLIQVSGGAAHLKKLGDVEATRSLMRAQLNSNSVPAEKRKELERFIDIAAEEMALEFKQAEKSLLDRVVQFYTKEVPKDDVQALIEFYEGPLGKRMVEITSRLDTQLLILAMEWSQGVTQKVMPRVAQRVLEEKMGGKP